MKKPRILIFDIETSYVRARLWRTGEQYVGHETLIPNDESGIICIGYKWLGEKTIHSLNWHPKKHDSLKMMKEFIEVIESADICVAHNGEKFDIKKINTEALLYGLDPINWPPCEDTLKIARKYFSLPSNKLDYLAKILLGEGKIITNFQHWIDIVEKNCPKALAYMIRYCKRDVDILERVYLKLKTFSVPKANRSIIMHNNRDGCPSCGSKHVIGNGTRVTTSGKYQRMKCEDCGHCFKGSTIKIAK